MDERVEVPPIPEGAGFTADFLTQLKFTSGTQAFGYLRALARQNGFDLASRDALADGKIRLYCHRANRGAGKTNTTKTGCEFRLAMHRHGGIYTITPFFHLEHNHPFLPAKEPALPQDVEEHAKLMAKIGVGRPTVVRFICEATGAFPTATQIASLFSPEQPHPDQSQTEALMEHVCQQGGTCLEYTVPTADGETVRAAVLTVTDEEAGNLKAFGDVLFLDGTAIRNPLGWTTYPITLVDHANHIVSGGLMFTAFERTDVFCWLIERLVTFLEGKVQTIFTDEDLAMLAAFEIIRRDHPDLYHRLCIWHKRANFERHVRALTRDPAVIHSALDLFDRIAYHRRMEMAEQAAHQLIALLPTIEKYFRDEIWDLRSLLTEAWRGNALTLGRRSNQAGESNNRMLRHTLSAGGHTLVEIRDGYSQSHYIKSAAELEALAKAFQSKHFLAEVYDINLSRELREKIDHLVNKSKGWVCRPADEPGLYIARFEGKHSVTEWQMRITDGQLPLCECNATSGTGLPCAHLIALFDQAADHQFPVQLIAARWIPDFEHLVIPPLPDLTIAEADKVQRILSRAASGDEDDTPPPPPDWLDDADRPPFPHPSDPIVAAADTQTRRYRRLMTVAKEVVQKASVNNERYDGILKGMQDMRDSLTLIRHGEIRDASGAPKGRRSKKGHSQPGPMGQTHCALCDSVKHNLPDCTFYPTFRKAQAAFAPPAGGKQQCRLCLYRGHRATTCPVIRAARELLRESNGKPFDPASSDSDAASSDSDAASSDSEATSSDSEATSSDSEAATSHSDSEELA